MEALMGFFKSSVAKWLGGVASLLVLAGWTYANVTMSVETNTEAIRDNRARVTRVEESVQGLKEDNREILTEIRNLKNQNERILTALEKE